MTIQELLKTLPALSASDLEKVRQRVAFLSKSSGASASTTNAKDDDDWLTEGFTQELKRRGLISGRLPKVVFPSNWAEKSKATREFLLKGYTTSATHGEKLALAELSARYLLDYLERGGLKPSPRALLCNTDKVYRALEDAFPGYWRAQLFPYCIGRGSSCQNA